VLGISLYWMTEITHCERHRYFVDEQRFGPYAFWHHEHHFKADNSLTEMTDIVYYKVRFGPLGDLANGIFVRKKLKAIFDFRRAKIEVLFERK
jgi:ligand-binding SRPBCC domain-containing protein